MSKKPSQVDQKLGAIPTRVEIDGRQVVQIDGQEVDAESLAHAYLLLREQFVALSARNEQMVGEYTQFLGRITGVVLRWEGRAAEHEDQLERTAAAAYASELGTELRKVLTGEPLERVEAL